MDGYKPEDPRNRSSSAPCTALDRFASKVFYRQHRDHVKPFGTVCVLLRDLCDPSAALRFLRFKAAITVEAPRTAGIAEKTFQAKQRWTAALLLAIVAGILSRDVWLLFRHPVAVGLDGYYYVLQIENLYDNGTLFFRSSTPVVIYLLSALKFVIDDTVFAIKSGGLAFHLALAAGVYATLQSLTRSSLHAISGTLIVAGSSVHLFMLSEYVANAGGLALLVWGAYFTLRAVRTSKLCWKIGAIICLAGAGLSHRSLVFMIAALAIVSLIYYLMTAAEAGRRRKLLVGLIGLVLFVSPSLLAAQTFVVLPAVLKDSLTVSPQLPVGRVAVLEKFILLVCSLLFLFVAVKKKRRIQPLTYVTLGTVATLSLLLTLNPFFDRSAGWSSASERISALAYVQLALLLPGVFWLTSSARRLWPLCPLTAVCFTVLSLATSLPHGLRDDYLLDRASLISELADKRTALANLQRVIAPHGEQFVVSYALGVPAQQRAAPGEDLSMAHWLVRRFDGLKLDSAGGTIVLSEETSTFLVPEKQLDVLLRATSINERFELTKANPHLVHRILSVTGTYRVSVK